MASVVITIETDGDAFHSCKPECRAPRLEIARILRILSVDFAANGIMARLVHDCNNRVVGKVELID